MPVAFPRVFHDHALNKQEAIRVVFAGSDERMYGECQKTDLKAV